MRGRRSAALGVIAAAALSTACYVFHFGNPDRTLYRELPRDVPPEQWLTGRPRVAVVFEGVFRSFGGGPPVRDENASMTYARLLRKAGVFAAVGGPDVARAPEAHGRVRIEMRYEEDLHDTGNLAKAAIAPGLIPYRLDLRGTTELYLELPGSEPKTYAATTALTRLYYRSQRRDQSIRLLYREVEDRNFLVVVHKLRAERLLFDPPAPASGRPLPAHPDP